ncbi:MAG: phosphoribosylformylglycinamidine cyclo-ligase [Gammaproteobacteria bacterium]|nr:phosphoribosylformylglycinamidine cyclo-ligase [Gammaproteobacteria bacterium]
MPDPKRPRVSYADAGVSIERGDQLVERIKPHIRRTRRAGVMGDIGGFGAQFDLSSLGYRNPVLVSGTDGVGTKIQLAIAANRHDDIGIDLVAMCANDVLVQGAEPLFFLDYYVCGTLDLDVAERVVHGIAHGCELAGCALVGGETAEHPAVHPEGDYDLAGFCVGIVEKDRIIDGSRIRPGDALIGIASSGLHSNGFSLVRRLLEGTGTRLTDRFGQATYADTLLIPTRIYVKPVLKLIAEVPVKGIAHITGGGILENVPRILPAGCAAAIDTGSWQWPAIFTRLQAMGNIAEKEIYRTFNCGVGMVLAVALSDADRALQSLKRGGEAAWIIGAVVSHSGEPVVLLNP